MNFLSSISLMPPMSFTTLKTSLGEVVSLRTTPSSNATNCTTSNVDDRPAEAHVHDRPQSSSQTSWEVHDAAGGQAQRAHQDVAGERGGSGASDIEGRGTRGGSGASDIEGGGTRKTALNTQGAGDNTLYAQAADGHTSFVTASRGMARSKIPGFNLKVTIPNTSLHTVRGGAEGGGGEGVGAGGASQAFLSSISLGVHASTPSSDWAFSAGVANMHGVCLCLRASLIHLSVYVCVSHVCLCLCLSYTCLCLRLHLRLCLRLRLCSASASVSTSASASASASATATMSASASASASACTCTSACTSVCVRAHVCARVCVRARVRASGRIEGGVRYADIYIYTCIYVYIYT